MNIQSSARDWDRFDSVAKSRIQLLMWRGWHFSKWLLRGGDYPRPVIEPHADLRALCRALRRSKTSISIVDFGGASAAGTSVVRTSTVGRLARVSAKSARQAGALAALVEGAEAEHVLELGTCLGTTAACLAAVPHRPHIVSIEGDPGLAEMARKNIKGLRQGLNVEVVEGEISLVLPEVAARHAWDLVFIDGHHCSEALNWQLACIMPHLSPEAVVVIDDIYWSRDMHDGWLQQLGSGNFQRSFDAFHFGVLWRSVPLQT